MDSSIRPSAVAGMFYPASASRLEDELANLLSLARPGLVQAGGFHGRLRALIVPHAGYIYSGSIAASAYAALESFGRKISSVAIFGPAHRVPLRGLALPSWTRFQTPLGLVTVNKEGVDSLLALPFSSTNNAAHAQEHSIEVQLPFLQTVLHEISVIPILFGQIDPARIAEAIGLLWRDEETLVIVSSDLSHYLPALEAEVLDASTARRIEDLDSGIEPDRACGAAAINGLLMAAREHCMHVTKIDLGNSSDTAGDASSVVGYGAFGFCDGGCFDA